MRALFGTLNRTKLRRSVNISESLSIKFGISIRRAPEKILNYNRNLRVRGLCLNKWLRDIEAKYSI